MVLYHVAIYNRPCWSQTARINESLRYSSGYDVSFYITKIIVTAALIVVISELSKRNTLAGAIFASIPLVSVLAMSWLYWETKDVKRISVLATNVFWLTLPSLVLFVTFPLFIKNGLSFYPSIGISLGITVGCYFLMLLILNHYGVKI
ncbi:MAG: DUF3147 family protein [Desulforhopalus sp.]